MVPLRLRLARTTIFDYQSKIFPLKRGQTVVRVKGLEPSHLSIPEPKSGASTNSATPAQYTFNIGARDMRYQARGVKRVMSLFWLKHCAAPMPPL